ncbi:MAG TPA: hypothetical protein VIL30_07565 [Ramlibacter sp.]|jgi:hypothetical protein
MPRIVVLYDYSISYIKFRKQRASSAFGRGSIELTLREVAAADLHPIAILRSGEHDYQGRDRFQWSYQRPHSRYVEFEDKTWLEWGSLETLINLVMGDAFADYSPFAHVSARRWSERIYTTLQQELSGSPNAREAYDDEAFRLQTLHEMAQRLIVVDGQVFEQVLEPELRVSVVGDGEVAITLKRFVLDYVPGRDDFSARFRSLRLPFHCRKDRIDRLDELCKRVEAAGYRVRVDCTVEVIDGSRIRRYPALDALKAGVGDLLSGLMPQLREMDADQVAAIIDLRDAYVAAGGNLSTEVQQAIYHIAQRRHVTGADLYRSRWHAAETQEAYAIAQTWARQFQLTLQSDASALEVSAANEYPSRSLTTGIVQQLRSPERLFEMAGVLGQPFEELKQAIADGGSVHSVRVPSPPVSVTTSMEKLSDEIDVGCFVLNRDSELVSRHVAEDAASLAFLVDEAIGLIAPSVFEQPSVGMR